MTAQRQHPATWCARTLRRSRQTMCTVCYPPHLKRTLIISFLVGSWLVVFNLGDVILRGDLGFLIWVKLALNYLTPFVVTNLGLLSRKHL